MRMPGRAGDETAAAHIAPAVFGDRDLARLRRIGARDHVREVARPSKIDAAAEIRGARWHRRCFRCLRAGKAQTRRSAFPCHFRIKSRAIRRAGELLNEIEPGKGGRPATFYCDCDEAFSEEVWHCPICAHHWPMGKDQCGNCHEGEPPEIRVGAHPNFPAFLPIRPCKPSASPTSPAANSSGRSRARSRRR